MGVNGTPSHICGVSLVIWDKALCYLPPDTSEHTPPWPQPEAGTRFTCPWGMEGWVDV